MTPPRLLVTGAAGQIGGALRRALRERGLDCRAVDRVPTPGEAGALVADLCDPGAREPLARLAEGATHAVHLAGWVSNEKDLSAFRKHFDNHVLSALAVLGALPAGARQFLFASSMTVYGAPERLPVDESHPTRPLCLYGLGKLAAERFLAAEASRRGVRLCVLRLASVYGPGMPRERAIPSMAAAALSGRRPRVRGDGATRRDYVHVDDVCGAILAASLGGHEGVFNVGSGSGVSMRDLARQLMSLCGVPGEPESFDGPPDEQADASLVYDIARMTGVLGYRPSVPLSAGLRAVVDALRPVCRKRRDP